MTGRKPRHGGNHDPTKPHRYQTREIVEMDDLQEFPPEQTGTRTPVYEQQTFQSKHPMSTADTSYKPPISQQPYVEEGQMSEAKAEVVGWEAPKGTITHRYSAKPVSIIIKDEKPKRLIGGAHAFTGTFWRWTKPHRIKLPGYIYHDPNVLADPKDHSRWSLELRNLAGKPKKVVAKFSRHRDFMGRVIEVPYDDRYLHHETGELRKLIVSCTDEIFSSDSTVTWRRTYIRNCSPRTVRLATWIIDVQGHPDGLWTWCKMAAKTIPGGLLMSAFVMEGVLMEGREQFNGDFAPVPYKYNGTAKVWTNWRENFKNTSTLGRNTQSYHQLRPRLLCFWRDARPGEPLGVDILSPEEWENGLGRGQVLNYVFVTYTSEHFSADSDEDMYALDLIAQKAARDAGVPAYWIATSCMASEGAELERDVYCIADVLRGAHDMVIAVGQPRHNHNNSGYSPFSGKDLLAQWGSRIWTFPEVLLSPGLEITVYNRDVESYEVISKSQFAAVAWANIDAADSSQLVSHYLNSIELSRIELSVIALKCLFSRSTNKDGYYNGDHSYALMGLLRCRPQVDETDSQFQAFARLSLANDSDKLMERYLCTLPLSGSQPWHDMSDAYHSSLWDIEPRCQVAGICEDDTIILDGAWGASIRWKSFFPIKCTTNDSLRRWLAIQIMLNQGWLPSSASTLFGLLTSNTANSTAAPSTTADGSAKPTDNTQNSTIDWKRMLPDNSPQYWVVFGLGCLLIVIYLLVVIYSAALIRVVYGGKSIGTQAALFGFEGYLDAATVEKSIFGGVFGRISWSENGSLLSRWHINDYNERLGVDPVQNDRNVARMVNQARYAGEGQPRIFTLVDTNSMQMTLFEAARPPVCVILCGSEGGMQRAVGCSYDWETQTMYRETVLRMPTESLDKMARVPRFRMGVANLRQPRKCYSRTGSGGVSV